MKTVNYLAPCTEVLVIFRLQPTQGKDIYVATLQIVQAKRYLKPNLE